MSIDPQKFIYEFLKNGASADMNVDGSTPVTFKWTSTGSAHITRLNFTLVDGAMQYGKFGGLTALDPGCQLAVFNAADTELLDFTGGLDLTTNEDWAPLAGVDSIAEPSAGDDFMPVRFTIAKAGGTIHIAEGEYIACIINDDLGDLSTFRCMVQGYYS